MVKELVGENIWKWNLEEY